MSAPAQSAPAPSTPVIVWATSHRMELPYVEKNIAADPDCIWIGGIKQYPDGYYADGDGKLITDDYFAEGIFQKGRLVKGVTALKSERAIYVSGTYHSDFKLEGPDCKLVYKNIIVVGDCFDGFHINAKVYNSNGKLMKVKTMILNNEPIGHLLEYKASENYAQVTTSYRKSPTDQFYITDMAIIPIEQYEKLSIPVVHPAITYDLDTVLYSIKNEIISDVLHGSMCSNVEKLIMSYC